MQLTDYARNAQLDALGEMLKGGELRIYDGQAKRGSPLVKFPIASVSEAHGGKIELSIYEPCLAAHEGTAKRYSLHDKAGKEVATGEVGKDFEVTPDYFVQGTRAMVDAIVIEG